MRPSEYLGLKWQDIDWTRQTVSVVRSVRRLDGRWCFCDTKRSRSRRPIKLQRWIVALLRDLQTKASAHSLCLEGRDLVFKTASGHPIHADYLAKHFKMILELAGLPRIRLYDLRHSAATIALAAGVSPKVVSDPEQLRVLSEWLIEQQIEEVVMESTAQYWKPVWGALERYWKPMCQSREGAGRMSGTLHLAQALSNRGQRGRKRDFRDAERLVKRLVSQELILSFMPDAEQCLWRTQTRTRYQRTRDKVRLQNRLESLLEEAHIKLSSLVSDLLGASARRILKALADGETNPPALAALADKKLRATQAQLCDALGACAELNPVYRRLLKMALEELQFLEQQIVKLEQEMASLLSQHQEAVQRLAEVPGIGEDAAQQSIADVGANAATFP